MTNEQNGLSGIENLTPFEYALAGVSPTGNQDSPSLAVVEQMRALAAEVEDAPITQVRLQELMQGNAGQAKRNERRALKRRRATADGGFVDITPAELTEQNRSYKTDDDSSRSDAATAAGFVALGGLAAGASQLNDDVAFAETEPTSEQPAINLSDTDVSAALPASAADDVTDPLQLGEDGIVAELGDGPDADEIVPDPTALAEEDFERQFDAIQAAMLDGEPEEEPTFYDIPIGEDDQLDDELVGAAGYPEGHDVDEPPVETAALGVSVFDTPPAIGEQLFDRSELEFSDPADRFAGDHLFDAEHAAFEAEAPLYSDGEDPGTPVLVTAGGDGLLLDDEHDQHDEARNPLAAAALTGTVGPPPVVPERRFGGAFWALAGTAVAAAVLALGGLLWANSLNDGTTTESASAAEDTDATDDGTELSADGTDQGSTESDADAEDTSTGSLTDGTDTDDDRPALAVDGEDTGSVTTLDPDTTATTVADGEDPDEAVTGTTAAVTTDTTAPDATDPSESTEAPTTEPADPSEETTVPPTTAPPEPEPIPETTPAPIIGPSFIGDRVTLGSFEGPGVSGVRVRLFADADRNGVPEGRLAIDDTDAGGFYGFDEFPAGCYVVEFAQLPGGITLDAVQTSQAFCIEAGDQNGRFDAVAVVEPPDNCIVEASNTFRDRGVEVHENDFDLADSYTFYNQNGGVVFRTSQAGPPDDLDNNSYGDYEWFAQDNGFNHRNVQTVAAERFGVESAPIVCERQ